MEIELKYQIPDKYKLEDFNMVGSDRINMHAYYFDVDDFSLYKNNLSFRVRYENDDLVCTVKYDGKVVNGLHTRGEINIPCDESFLKHPSIEILKGYECYDLYKKIVKDRDLKLIVEMNYVRHEKKVEYNESKFSLTFDDGKIESKGEYVKIYEIEVELAEGNESDLTDFGEKLAKKYDLVIENRSKFERVYDLLYKK